MTEKQRLLAEISNAAGRGYAYYVYTLSDSDGVFYVGKGRAGRVFTHGRPSPRDSNARKKQRVETAGDSLRHVMLAYFNDEGAAYAFETAEIRRRPGLTNILLGDLLTPIERARARAQDMLDRMVPYERWQPPALCDAFVRVLGLSGPREVYDVIRANLVEGTVNPTPTTICFDRHGRETGRRYDERHDRFRFQAARSA